MNEESDIRPLSRHVEKSVNTPAHGLVLEELAGCGVPLLSDSDDA